jgi:hypothetical protein
MSAPAITAVRRSPRSAQKRGGELCWPQTVDAVDEEKLTLAIKMIAVRDTNQLNRLPATGNARLDTLPAATAISLVITAPSFATPSPPVVRNPAKQHRAPPASGRKSAARIHEQETLKVAKNARRWRCR